MGETLKHYQAARIILGAYGISQHEFNHLTEVELTHYLSAIEELETARRQKLVAQFFLSGFGAKKSSRIAPSTNTHVKTRVVHSLRRRPPGENK